mmetsp:Transcript_48220/g.126928  ORF Transcript_48220/g.126928 Transcript_48220/m.126928 type:complete len:381 (-) Transcript_48220:125-1267(-)
MYMHMHMLHVHVGERVLLCHDARWPQSAIDESHPNSHPLPRSARMLNVSPRISLLLQSRAQQQVGGGPEDRHRAEGREPRDVVVVGALDPPASAAHILADGLKEEGGEDRKIDRRDVHELRAAEELGVLGTHRRRVGDGDEAGREREGRADERAAVEARLGHVPREEAERRARDGRGARLAQGEVGASGTEAEGEGGADERSTRQRRLALGAGQQQREVDRGDHAEGVEDGEEDRVERRRIFDGTCDQLVVGGGGRQVELAWREGGHVDREADPRRRNRRAHGPRGECLQHGRARGGRRGRRQYGCDGRARAEDPQLWRGLGSEGGERWRLDARRGDVTREADLAVGVDLVEGDARRPGLAVDLTPPREAAATLALGDAF